MRVSPPIEVGLRRHDRWRVFVLTVLLVTGAVVAAWVATAEFGVLWKALVVCAGLPAFAAGVSMAFPADRVLRWTGRHWQLSGFAGDPAEIRDGEVRVALDLGSWMLLRFTPTQGPPRAVTWLPVQRRGLEAGWHGLRCAVYAPHLPPSNP